MRRAVSSASSAENVQLVIIGYRHKGFGVDTGLCKNVAVQGVAIENTGITQVLRKEMRAGCITLDDLHLGILEMGLDLACQHLADIPPPAITTERARLFMRRPWPGADAPIMDKIDPVTRLHHFSAVARQGQFAIADDRKDCHRQVGEQVGQMTDRRIDDRFLGYCTPTRFIRRRTCPSHRTRPARAAGC